MEMNQDRLEEQAADSLLSGGPAGASGTDFVRVGPLLRAVRDVAPLPDASANDPIVAMMASLIRESAPVAAPTTSRRAPARRTFFRTRVVAGLLAALLLVGGGLAFAGVLPASLQTRASHLLHRIGIHAHPQVTHPATKPPVPLPSGGPSPVGHHGHGRPPTGGSSGSGSHTGGSGSQGAQGGQGGQGQQGGDGSGNGGSGGSSGDGGSGGGSGSGGNQGGSGSSGSSGNSGGQSDQGSGTASAGQGSGSDQG
jgi:hypothetical protein